MHPVYKIDLSHGINNDDYSWIFWNRDCNFFTAWGWAYHRHSETNKITIMSLMHDRISSQECL